MSLVIAVQVSCDHSLSKTGSRTQRFEVVSPLRGSIQANLGILEPSGGGWFQRHVGGSGMLAIEKGTVAINVNSYSFGSGSTPNRDLTINGGSFQLDSSTYVNHAFLTADVIERVWQQEDVKVTVEKVTDLRSWSPAAVTERHT